MSPQDDNTIFQLTIFIYKLFELKKNSMCVCYNICNVGQWPLCMKKLFDFDFDVVPGQWYCDI